MNSYDIVYILGNFFMAFVLYKFIHVFYSNCKVDTTIERVAYLAYSTIITAVHIFLKIPLAVMIANIVLILALTLLYDGKIRKAVLTMAIVYFSFMTVETIFAFLTSALQLKFLAPFQYESEFGIVVIRIASFVLVLFAQGFKSVKNEYPLPSLYWISLLAIPTGTIIMLFSIFTNTALPKVIMLMCMVSALAINLFSFYLYDRISALLVSQMNKRIAEEQNRYYEYLVQMMESTLNNMRILRHDLKNKLSPLYSLAVAGKSDELVGKLAELTSICDISKEYSKSGNSTVDSIINFKLQQAESNSIRVSTDILIPNKLAVPTFDIAAILGNILDNALEAVILVEDRWIDIKVKYTKGRLIAEVSNSYDGIVKKVGGCYRSRKEDTLNHGIGLKSVETVLQKYDGTMQITPDEKVFKTKILMYL